MARKTKKDWYIASINILIEKGSGGLTIDALTTQLGVTKGSFYHHFGSYQQFKIDLLTFFEEEGTLGIITQTEQADTPQEKLRRLMDIIVAETARYPAKMEVALRAWGLQDSEVGGLIARVDQQRIGYVQALCAEIVGDDEQGLLMAEMMYTILIGSEHTMPALSPTRLRPFFDEFLRLYMI